MLKKRETAAFDSLKSYVERINELNGGTSSSLFVIQNRAIVAEHYSGTHSDEAGARATGCDSQYNVASVRKSYIGFAAAWALNEGAIRSFDDPILEYMPLAQEDREMLSGVTIRHLLTHTHGLVRDGRGRLVRAFSPGCKWDYNNEGIQLLTDILSEALNRTVADLLASKVFRPLGWRETGWRSEYSEELVSVMQEGRASLPLNPRVDGSRENLFVSARELAYWGYMHLNSGKIAGRTLVPEQVIRYATTVQTQGQLPPDHPRNGCLWLVKEGKSAECLIGEHVPRGSYEIVGFYGPLVLVVPQLDLVVVRMANTHGNYEDDKGSYIHYLKEFSDLAVEAALLNKG